MDFASLIGLSIGAIIVIAVIGLAILVFEVAMFIDAILNKNITDEVRILWLVGMILIHPFVAIAYYFTDHKKRQSPPPAI